MEKTERQAGANAEEKDGEKRKRDVLVREQVRGRSRAAGEEKQTNRSKTERRKMNETFKCSQLFFCFFSFSLTNSDE